MNHKWLEDCFVSWSLVTLAQQQYVEFPPAINFGNLVCKRVVEPLTEDDLDILERAEEERPTAEPADAQAGLQNERDETPDGSRATRMTKRQDSERRPKSTLTRQSIQNSALSSPTKAVHKIDRDSTEDGEIEQEDTPRRRTNVKAMKNSGPAGNSEDIGTAKQSEGQAVILGLKHSAPSENVQTADEAESTEKHHFHKIPQAKRATHTKQPDPTRTKLASSLFGTSELTDEDDQDLPEKLTMKDFASNVKGKHRSNINENEENVNPETSTKVGPPRGAKKSDSSSSPQRSKTFKPVAVEIAFSPKASKKAPVPLNRTQSIVAVAADGAASQPSPKWGRPKKRVESASEHETANSSRLTREASEDTESDAPRLLGNSTVPERTPLKRSAATKAAARLHDMGTDMIKFEKEMRTGNIRNSWEDRKRKINNDTSLEEGKKRRASTSTRNETEEVEDENNKRDRKKRKVELSRGEGRGETARPTQSTSRFKRQMSTASAEDGQSQASGAGANRSKEGSSWTLMTTKVVLEEDVLKVRRKLLLLF